MHRLNSVRRLRKSQQLAQHELAELLGLGQSSISRIEAGELPDARTLIALQVLFDLTTDDLFAAHYQSIGELVVGRASRLDLRLQGERPRASLTKKREWLNALVARVTPQPA